MVLRSRLFKLLEEKKILREDEMALLKWMYAKTRVRIGEEVVDIDRGVTQGSTISPLLFDIYS